MATALMQSELWIQEDTVALYGGSHHPMET
jgi:hypothetical protein